MTTGAALQGIFPIVPTIFDDEGELDEGGQRGTVEALIADGVHGLVVLANASEGYAVTDDERPRVIAAAVRQAGGRVPVVVTCNHPSTVGAVRHAKEAEGLGASAVMFLPPFFGQWQSDPDGIRRHSEALSRATTVPLILQDHPLSGITMPAAFLADLAARVERLAWFKVEAARAPVKIGQMLRLAPGSVRGVFGGTAGILFLEELDRGAVGTMPSSLVPEMFVRMLSMYRAGQVSEAATLFACYLPLISFEIQLGGHRAAKELLALRGTIRSPLVRDPIRSRWDEPTQAAFRRLLDATGLLAGASGA